MSEQAAYRLLRLFLSPSARIPPRLLSKSPPALLGSDLVSGTFENHFIFANEGQKPSYLL
jgi:hypothetical protein